MIQKTIIAILVLSIAGAAVVGIYDATRISADANTVSSALELNVDTVSPEQQTMDGATPEPQPFVQSQTNAVAEPLQLQQSVDQMGESWNATAVISSLDDFGVNLNLADGSSVYVELGPPTYWQAQGITFTEGDLITVLGWANGEQIHAREVNTATGESLVVRNDTGQPLWSGGADRVVGEDGTVTAGGGQNQVQIAPEEWITLSGTLSQVANGSMTFAADDGSVIPLQLGQPSFWQSQGVTLVDGDAVSITGYWMNDQFLPGDIVKTATGERIMLRDPNGRQLWGGPGRNGQNGQGQNTHTDPNTVPSDAEAGQSAGPGGTNPNSASNGQGNNGNGGAHYRGGRS